MQRDSLQNTFIVAASVCAVCSLIVSMAAVSLRPWQNANKELDRQRNILEVAGFDEQAIKEVGVKELFQARFKDIIIDLETGEDVTAEYTDGISDSEEARSAVSKFDQFKGAKTKKKDLAEALSSDVDIATIKWQENHSHVYLLMSEDGSTIEKYVFPVRGYGLWSTMFGFICLESDLTTVAGLTFYEHGETPGLGGEIDNAIWKRKWAEGHSIDKDNQVRIKLYDESGDVAVSVIKGTVNPNNPSAAYQMDGLSGATITSDGVTKLIKFWMGDTGFKPWIEKQRTANASAAQSSDLPSGIAKNKSTSPKHASSSTANGANDKGNSDG